METRTIGLEDIKKDPTILAYIDQADKSMNALGYTEHGRRHADLVAHISQNIMKRLGFSDRQAELAAVAGYLHDVGNAISRSFHGVSGALLAKSLLENIGMFFNISSFEFLFTTNCQVNFLTANIFVYN